MSHFLLILYLTVNSLLLSVIDELTANWTFVCNFV